MRLIATTVSGAIAGGALVLLIAFALIAILPGDGFAALGVAAFTKIVGVPVGAMAGATLAFIVGRRRGRSIEI